MRIFSNTEINQICLDTLASIQAFDVIMYDLLLNCYNLGTRYSETRYCNNWQIDQSNNYILQPFKGNQIRVFNQSELTPLLRLSIETQQLQYETCRYTTVTRYMSRYSPYPFLMTGNKQLSTHIFRHNKYKQLYEQLGSLSAVAQYFGEPDFDVALGYINSVIYIN